MTATIIRLTMHGGLGGEYDVWIRMCPGVIWGRRQRNRYRQLTVRKTILQTVDVARDSHPCREPGDHD